MSAPPAHPHRRNRTIDEPITLTRVYTRAGDAGQTRLADGTRVDKDDRRVEAYGTVDELNCAIGLATTAPDLPGQLRPLLLRIQNELFDLGADLAVPAAPDGPSRLRVAPEQVRGLEDACDELNDPFEPLRSFVLPGGTEAAARLHLARAVCRRAERLTVALGRRQEVNPAAIAYLNRLGDLLFVCARVTGGDELRWRPGASTEARAGERIFGG